MNERFLWSRIIGAVVADRLGIPAAEAEAGSGLNRVNHIIVLYLENHSFDNLLGAFPGANGLAQNSTTFVQRDRDGVPYRVLPSVQGPFDVGSNPADVRPIPLSPLPNEPFAIDGVDPRVTVATTTRGLTHLFYTNRTQINKGANDWFAPLSDAGGLTMGYYGQAAMEQTHLWKAARTGVVLDNFF